MYKWLEQRTYRAKQKAPAWAEKKPKKKQDKYEGHNINENLGEL